jgi:hypothetical protein
MIRSAKDLVLRENGDYTCFTCWNKLVAGNSVVVEHKTFSFDTDDIM